MKWSAGLSFLSALRDREAAQRPDDDHADMGTAFGLDASFGAVPELPEHGCADADAAGDGATPPWEARLIRRSGL